MNGFQDMVIFTLIDLAKLMGRCLVVDFYTQINLLVVKALRQAVFWIHDL